MSARTLLLALTLGILCACSQPQQSETAEVATPAPVDAAQSTGGECGRTREPEAGATMQSQGSAAGFAISATPGALACSEPGLEGAVECAFTGPGQVLISGATSTGYTIDAGQTATVVVGPNGPSCTLNANGV